MTTVRELHRGPPPLLGKKRKSLTHTKTDVDDAAIHRQGHHACIEGRGHYTGMDFGFCGAPRVYHTVAVGRNFRCNDELNFR